MNLIEFNKIYSNGFLSSFTNTGSLINPGIILGALIITVFLVFILVVLLIKSIKNINNMTRCLNKLHDEVTSDDSIDEYAYDDITDDEYYEDTIELDDEDDNDNSQAIESPTDSGVISYIDKLIDINGDLESYSFAYDSDTNDFYSIMYPWQRRFGYCSLYDEAAPALSLIFDSEPIYFDYNGKHWLIQFWKGQYGITTGAEVGIYNTKSKELNIPGLFKGRFYHAVDDSERLEIGFSLLKNNKVITKRKGLHWWQTSFILGEFSNPHELMMYIEIHFPNSIMRNSFEIGLLSAGYSKNDYSILDNVVYIVFDKPYTRQPYTKTDFIENLMQENNKRNVDLFNQATDSFTNVIDKLYMLRQDSPDYYDEVLKLGKPKQLFGSFNAIKTYLD